MGSVIICRLRFQLCLISLTVGIWKTLCYFKKALILATAKRHLDIASSFDREDGAKEGQEELCIPSLVLSIQIFLQKKKIACAVCVTSPIQYFKKSAVEIRSMLCLADSSSYCGKLRQACSGFEVCIGLLPVLFS